MAIPILETFDRLTQAKVLVVGDLILDHYVHGSTERTSPEAPVPVVLFSREEYIPGGAANVARNVTATGAQARLVGFVGADKLGETLLTEMKATGADCRNVMVVEKRSTTTKTRIVSQNQQVVRLDRETCSSLPADAEGKLLQAIQASLDGCGAVIASDYAKGVLSPYIVQQLIEAGRNRNIPILVDPKGRDYRRYRGASLITPNAKEAYEATGIRTDTEEGLTEAAARLLEITECETIVITRGPQGLALFRQNREPLLLPTFARDVYDVTGAGDTFVAFLGLGSAVGLDVTESARIANAAAGVVVGKSGAATVSLSEVRSALLPDRVGRKLRGVSDLASLGESLRSAGKRIVFTNGCFDFLHAGHVAFLEKARSLGDVLVLATNTDEMITKLKGHPRPIIPQAQRQSLLAAIESVDYVIPFGDETPHALLEALKPDLLVKGSNYRVDQVQGHEIVLSYGGEVRLLDVLEDFSTRELLAQRKK